MLLSCKAAQLPPQGLRDVSERQLCATLRWDCLLGPDTEIMPVICLQSSDGQLTLMGEAVVLAGREDRPDAPGRCPEGSGLRRRRPREREGPSSSSSLVKAAYRASERGGSFPDAAALRSASSSSSLTISAMVAWTQHSTLLGCGIIEPSAGPTLEHVM